MRSRIGKSSSAVAVAVAMAAGFALQAALPARASAGSDTPCWVEVVNDWAKDRQIATTYPVKCYTDALKNAPDDLKGYSTFEEDVLRARQAAIRARQQPSPQPSPPPSSPSPPAPSPSPAPSPAPTPAPAPAPLPSPAEPAPVPSETPLPVETAPGDPAAPPPTETAPVESVPTETEGVEPIFPVDDGTDDGEPAPVAGGSDGGESRPHAGGPIDDFFTGSTPDDARSVPVALIVLCAVAGALAVAGAGILGWRYWQERQLAASPIPGPVGDVPAPHEVLRGDGFPGGPARPT